MTDPTDCLVCSVRDAQPEHFNTEQHKRNASLKQFASNKQQFVTYRKGVAAVTCSVRTSLDSVFENKNGKVKISGPREQCTEKREFDMYGKKCAPGYYCHKWAGVCTGPEYRLDSNWQWTLIPFTGRRSDLKVQPEDAKFPFEGLH